MGSHSFDHSKFDALLEQQLRTHSSDTWPKTLNRHALFISLGAIPETPKVENTIITAALAQEVSVKRKDGTIGMVPRGFAMAAKRASKVWTTSKQFQRAQKSRLAGRATNEGKAWRALITQKFRSMSGGRMRASGFIRVGWVSVIRLLGPLVGGRYNRGSNAGVKLNGPMKGSVSAARAGKFEVVIKNFAQAVSDKKHGLIRFGEPGLQRAFDKETASLAKHLEEDMKPETDKFNAANH